MDLKLWGAAAAVFGILTIGICGCIIIYFIKREKKLTERIQWMLEEAITGKFRERHLDESSISAIENQMWRYLQDREAALEKLTGEQQKMQTHISDISHQAVIPIANIVLYSQLLEEWIRSCQTEDAQEVKEEILAIREQAETLDFLIEALVKLSRLETGIIHVNIKKQPLQPVLDAVKSQFHGIAAKKEIVFETVPTKEASAFDIKWTIEAVANIVDNAIKYTPRGGSVTVRVSSYPSFIRMDVSDDGIGIPEEEQARIFSRFYRSKTVSDEPGVGIGLYLAREVMKAQNGYIRLSSKPGEGSTFSLFFIKEEISQK